MPKESMDEPPGGVALKGEPPPDAGPDQPGWAFLKGSCGAPARVSPVGLSVLFPTLGENGLKGGAPGCPAAPAIWV